MERNPYLASTHKGIRRSYSYDMQSGKYFVESGINSKDHVHKTGKMVGKFQTQGTGFWDGKGRTEFVSKDPENLVHKHFVPDLEYRRHESYYTPIVAKFAGYAQQPYLANPQLPQHLRSQTACNNAKTRSSSLRSTINLSSTFKPQQKKSTTQKGQSVPFFLSSMMSMLYSRPAVRKIKKSCYMRKCREGKTKEQQSKLLLQHLGNSGINVQIGLGTRTSELGKTGTSFRNKTSNYSTGFS